MPMIAITHARAAVGHTIARMNLSARAHRQFVIGDYWRSEMPLIRRILLIAIALDLLMIGTQCFLYPPLRTIPGAFVFIAEPIVLLAADALLIAWLTKEANQRTHQTALVVG